MFSRCAGLNYRKLIVFFTSMSLTSKNCGFTMQSGIKPAYEDTNWISSGPVNNVHQLLMSGCSHTGTVDNCNKSSLAVDDLKSLLRLLISNEGRQLSTNSIADASCQAYVAAAAARGVDLRRYKTELCRSYAELGHCRYGTKCQFAHGAEELRPLARHPRYRTELCHSFHDNGFCPYGSRCNFIHGEPPAAAAAAEMSKDGPSTAGVMLAINDAAITAVAVGMPSSNTPCRLPVRGSAGQHFMMEQLLKQSHDVRLRAIIGRMSTNCGLN